MSKYPPVQIWCDGSVWPQQHGRGGWGAVLIYGEKMRISYGWVEQATNNVAEALAAVESLHLLTRPCRVHIFSDSQYVINGIDALRRHRMLQTNQDVWHRLVPLMREHYVTVSHVDGHETYLYNELADELAKLGSKHAQEGSFYVNQLAQDSEQAKLIQKVQRRIELRQRRKAAQAAGLA
jgi:ribonuclease HI